MAFIVSFLIQFFLLKYDKQCLIPTLDIPDQLMIKPKKFIKSFSEFFRNFCRRLIKILKTTL